MRLPAILGVGPERLDSLNDVHVDGSARLQQGATLFFLDLLDQGHRLIAQARGEAAVVSESFAPVAQIAECLALDIKELVENVLRVLMVASIVWYRLLGKLYAVEILLVIHLGLRGHITFDKTEDVVSLFFPRTESEAFKSN